MRVLFSPKEVAGQISVLSKTLRSLGVRATSLTFISNRFGYQVDRNVDIGRYPVLLQSLIKRILLVFFILKFDIFHFQAGRSLLLDNSDLPILKFFRKKVLMHFHGSEIRNPDYVATLGDGRRNLPPITTVKQVSQLRFLRNYVDKFIVATPDLLDLVPGAFYLPNSVGEGWFSYKKPKKSGDGFVILHAPSNRGLKGTNYVINACENLKKRDYKIKLILVENIPNNEVKKLYSQADVVVDQLLIGWYGVLAIENMAMGNPVIAYIDPKLRRKYAPDLPIIQSSRDNIEAVLERLIKNRGQLAKIGSASREYARRNHHPKANAKKLIDLYKSI